MRLEPHSPLRLHEDRRYFPDWTFSLAPTREELEADHNSYLAGGYAEEFGYRAEADSSRGVPVIDGESPDDCPERCAQAVAIHPGYPLAPSPIVLDRGSALASTARQSASASAGGMRAIEDRGTFFKVSERSYERAHRRLKQRAAAAFTRLRAALDTLGWELPRNARPPE